MRYQIHCRPSYSALEVELQPKEELVTEAGAMAWMQGNLKVVTAARGGALAGLKRAVLAGESFFQNTYQAVGTSGILGLVPGQPGDIVPVELGGDELFLERSAYLASSPGIRCDAKYQGLKGLFSEGFFVLRITGAGTLFFTTYGDAEEVQVDGSYVVDNGYAVAWEPTLQYHLTRARKIRSFLFSDQLLMQFTGQGKLWVQSRSPRALASWVYPYRRQKSND